MNIDTVSANQTFNGRIIVKNNISKAQNYLFNLHKPALDEMIKDCPFDILVQQSKSRKTIMLSSSNNRDTFHFVRKNKQNFEEVAGFVIQDARKKQEEIEKQQKIREMEIKANELLNYSKFTFMQIMLGDFKSARIAEQKFAKLAVENFDLVKKIPKINFKNAPFSLWFSTLINSLKYRIYKAFTPKTREEKQLAKLKKDYMKELSLKHEKRKAVDINLPSF